MDMNKQIEVEFIGYLSKEKFEELKEKFEKEGIYKKKEKRLSFMYFRNRIPKDFSKLKDEKVDLRIRITNRKPELVIKQGLFTGSHTRKEISLNFPFNEIKKYIDFLAILGWKRGVIYVAKIVVYKYKGVEFSLVNIKDYGYNFEAEILTEKTKEQKAKKRIIKLLGGLQLKPFDEGGLIKQCNEINNRKEMQFDFFKYSFNYIKKRFSEFLV